MNTPSLFNLLMRVRAADASVDGGYCVQLLDSITQLSFYSDGGTTTYAPFFFNEQSAVPGPKRLNFNGITRNNFNSAALHSDDLSETFANAGINQLFVLFRINNFNEIPMRLLMMDSQFDITLDPAGKIKINGGHPINVPLGQWVVLEWVNHLNGTGEGRIMQVSDLGIYDETGSDDPIPASPLATVTLGSSGDSGDLISADYELIELLAYSTELPAAGRSLTLQYLQAAAQTPSGSVKKQIKNAILAKVVAIESPSGLRPGQTRITRNILLTEGVASPCCLIEFGKETPDGEDTRGINKQMPFTLRIIAPANQLDDLESEVVTAIESDRQLGGLCVDIEYLGDDPYLDTAQGEDGGIFKDYLVKYRTRAAAPGSGY
jgi:hypothetical protein